MLEGVIPEEINQRVLAWLVEHDRLIKGGEAHGLLEEEWFKEHVVRNPSGAGAMRSLLGPNYVEPNWLSGFSGRGQFSGGQWHIDGGSRFGPTLDCLKWFYYPMDSPEESGPTEFVIGSHHVFHQVRFMAHYNGIRGTWKSSAPAGSIFLTAYALWHRRGNATWDKTRNMLTSSAWRTAPPQRDWITEPDFDFGAADYDRPVPRFGEQQRNVMDNVRMFFWLCGMTERFRKISGPTWPRSSREKPRRYGIPEGL